MSNNQELETYRGYVIRKETDPWRIKTGDLVNFDLIGNEIGEMTGNAKDIPDAKAMIDDLIAEEEAKTEAFQTKGALQYLVAVLRAEKLDTAEWLAKHPGLSFETELPAELDSLNYKWTQWAKQKIENLK